MPHARAAGRTTPGDHHTLPARPGSDVLSALGRCEAVTLSPTGLRSELKTSPTLQSDMDAAERRRCAIQEEHVISLGRRSALERTAHLVCEILTRVGGDQPSSSCIIPLRQHDLADMLGLSNVHTNRMLQTLKGLRLLQLSSQRLSTPDFPALAAKAAFTADYLDRTPHA